LEPDYEFMQRYQPAIDKFKGAFFGGEDSDMEASTVKSRAGARNGKGGVKAAPKGKAKESAQGSGQQSPKRKGKKAKAK